MIRSWWREVYESKPLLITFIVSVVVFFTSLVVMVTHWTYLLLPPYSVVETALVTKEVRPGEHLRIGFRIIRRRICQIDLDRFIIDDGDTAVFRQRVPGGTTPLGDDWVVIELKMPALPPGKYTYITTVTNNCADGTFVTQTPPVAFTVLSPTS